MLTCWIHVEAAGLFTDRDLQNGCVVVDQQDSAEWLSNDRRAGLYREVYGVVSVRISHEECHNCALRIVV